MEREVEKTVQIHHRKEIFKVSPGLKLVEALEELGIDPESVLGVRNGKMIVGETVLEAGDQVRLVAVISGG
jgi:sulfur carrier protein ThiS